MDMTALVPYMVPILIIGGLGFSIKSLVIRLEKVEKKAEMSIDEHQVRQILDDKLDPIKSDISDIKTDLKLLVNTKVEVELLKQIAKYEKNK